MSAIYLNQPQGSERQNIEQELRDSQARLAGIIASAMDAIITVDHEQRIVLFNAAAERMFGYASEEALLKPLDILIPERYRQAHRQHIRRFGQTGATNRAMGHLNTLYALRRDGSEFPIEASISQVTTTTGQLFSVILRDVTERVRSEEAQRENEQTLRATFDQAAVGIAHVSPQGRMLRVNQKMCAISGYSAGELLTRTIDDLTEPEFLDREHALIRRLLVGEIDTYVIEKRYLRKDRSTIWVNVTVSLVRDLHGEPKYMIKVIEDVSRRKDSEAALRANAEKIRALNAQTEKRLHRLTSLRTIDLAISSSLDQRVTMSIILDQVTTELSMDAADILLLDRLSQSLNFAAGRGMKTNRMEQGQILLGMGIAGTSALEQRTVQVPDLSAAPPDPERAETLEMEGFQSCFATPLISKGEVRGVLEVFHRARFAPDAEWIAFFEALAGQAAIAIDSAQLFDNLQRSNQQLFLAYNATIEGWSRALDLRDRETEGHTQRVTEITLRVARASEYPFSEDEYVQIRRGALLHDIGKMGVPDSILLKPSELTEDEKEVMRKHPEYAYQLLYPIVYLRKALAIPYCHHERWDGSGYPRGLKGEQIPLEARIFAVVDVWDALRSDRPYRPGWPSEQVIEYIRARSGTDFDPQVVEAFLDTISELT